ncbi:MAG: UDP-galactopyranose mutase [Verrucomicrobiota bacterium]|jgi:UDP-galactopyranose mutase
MKVCIVGAGLAGATAAFQLSKHGHQVEVFEVRTQIGGNCYDKLQNGVMVHQYGPHAFHTGNPVVWQFLNQFTRFNDVALRVWANTPLGMIPIPFNNQSAKLVGDMTPKMIRDLLFKDYSQKQWGVSWTELPKSIRNRVPLKRASFESYYHLDRYQGIPEKGYSEMFSAMLEGKSVHVGCKENDWRRYKWDHVIFTGSIDTYYGFCHGELPYRSLRFEYFPSLPRREVQINECNPWNSWTRSVDHSHWLRQKVRNTVISREYPCEFDGSNERFYPKPWDAALAQYAKYARLAQSDPKVTFVGRLGTYRYLDMDKTVAQTMAAMSRLIAGKKKQPDPLAS